MESVKIGKEIQLVALSLFPTGRITGPKGTSSIKAPTIALVANWPDRLLMRSGQIRWGGPGKVMARGGNDMGLGFPDMRPLRVFT